MHTNFFLPFFCIKKYFLQRAITPRELTPSPYFLLCRYILSIPMCLQKLMNNHHCVFKILGKKQCRGRTHGWTDTRTDVKTVYPPQTKFAGGYNKKAYDKCRLKFGTERVKRVTLFSLRKQGDITHDTCFHFKCQMVWHLI